MANESIFFIVVILITMFFVMIDLFFVGRNSEGVSIREASIWSCIWVSLALAFGVFLYFYSHLLHGIDSPEKLTLVVEKYMPFLNIEGLSYDDAYRLYQKTVSINFFTGYFIEESLSIDNLFVILLLLTSFGVPKKHYKTVLLWGVLGAIVMRFAFIFAGAALIQKAEWILYIFGLFLIYSGVKMYFEKKSEGENDPHNHFLVKTIARWLPVTRGFEGGKFIIRKAGILHITPLLLVLVLIEFTDLVFALDSIPAIFSVSRDPYIVFFSNIFAIMGLRSLFFVLANYLDKFKYLKHGIAILLTLVGIKILLEHQLQHIGFESWHFLIIILVIVGGSIVFSLLHKTEESDKSKH